MFSNARCVAKSFLLWTEHLRNILQLRVSRNRPEQAHGVPGRLRPQMFLTSSALRTGRLYPRRNPWYSFLEGQSTPGHMVPSVVTEKIPSDTTGNRSRDRPISSAVYHQVVHSVILRKTTKYTMFLFTKHCILCGLL